MALDPNNEKLQEISIVAVDKFRSVSKRWWYSLLAVVILCFPMYFLLRSWLASVIVSDHKFPAYIYQEEVKQPLTIVDQKIFSLPGNTYTGYVRIKNPNLEWGVAAQSYAATFSTTGGTQVMQIPGTTFILPASEKIIVFARFPATAVPTQLNVTLGESQFVQRPTGTPDASLNIERSQLSTASGQLVVSAAVTNNTPFTISRVDLPVLVYDQNNNIVAVNYTNINEVTSGETRTFQFSWPTLVAGAVRAEILPEVDIFDSGIYESLPGSSQFDAQPTNP